MPIVLVPGNHDVDLRESVAFDDRQDAYEQLVRDFYGADVYLHFPFLENPSDHGLTRREALVYVQKVSERALIVGVNSSALQDRLSFPIAVTSPVLGALQSHIDELGVAGDALRVFVLHHHLMPFVERPWTAAATTDAIVEEPDPTMVANSARVQDWLARNHFQLVLHGHKHVPHGREDQLWSGSSSRTSRRVVIVGAGSCGVNSDQREHGEHLSYNRIDASQLAGSEWRIRVVVQTVDEAQTPVAAVAGTRYVATAGTSPSRLVNVFESVDIVECHAEISSVVTPDHTERNFVSVVKDSEYRHPPTLRLGEEHPSIGDIARSFQSLHPEYSKITHWNDAGGMQAKLSERRFRIEHGSRMFLADANGHSPLDTAIDRLASRSTWAYAGLYRWDTDTEEEPVAFPGLMGVQFVLDSAAHRIDLVANFRNLELSFWWGVNMYELRLLLEHAVTRSGRTGWKPGSITMFSALATWKSNPEPVFTAQIDSMQASEFYELAIALEKRTPESLELLKSLLENKDELTSRNNVELSGLRQLATALTAVSDPATPALVSAHANITRAIRFLSDAEQYSQHVQEAKDALREAIDGL